MEKPNKGYLACRLILGSLNTLSDVVVGLVLLTQGHGSWAALVLTWPLLGFLVALLAVVIGAGARGSSLSCAKLVLLTLR